MSEQEWAESSLEQFAQRYLRDEWRERESQIGERPFYQLSVPILDVARLIHKVGADLASARSSNQRGVMACRQPKCRHAQLLHRGALRAGGHSQVHRATRNQLLAPHQSYRPSCHQSCRTQRSWQSEENLLGAFSRAQFARARH